MPYTLQQCNAAAAQAGFDPASGGIACNIFNGESGLDPNVPCTCSTAANQNIPDNWLHGYDTCVAAGLTPACGLGQWQTTTAPELYAQQGCVGDLLCELKALFQITGGGQCWGPWGPHVGKPYGYCQTSPLTGFSASGSGSTYTLTGNAVQGGSSGGSPPCTWNPASWLNCNFQIPGTGNASANPGDWPQQIRQGILGPLADPSTWLRVGLVVMGGVVVAVGLAALAREGARG